jgi:hypothetical protein
VDITTKSNQLGDGGRVLDVPGITEIADARTEAWRPGDSRLGGGTRLFSEPQPAVTRLLDLAVLPAVEVLAELATQ